MNKAVVKILHTMATDIDAKRVNQLSFVEFAIYSLVNALTGKTPFDLVYGQQVQNVVDQFDGLHQDENAQQMVTNISKLMEEAKARLLWAQESQAKYYDQYHHPIELAVNDKIILSTRNLQLSGIYKFQQRFVGPIMVLERIGSQAYRFLLPSAFQRFHNISMYPCENPMLQGVEQPQPIIIDGKPEWEVEAILQHRHHCSVQQDLVKYAGYDQSEAMWLDEADLVNAPNIFADYKACMR